MGNQEHRVMVVRGTLRSSGNDTHQRIIEFTLFLGLLHLVRLRRDVNLKVVSPVILLFRIWKRIFFFFWCDFMRLISGHGILYRWISR